MVRLFSNNWFNIESILLIILVSIVNQIFGESDHCNRQYFDQNSFVCVCNLTDCGAIEPTTPVPKGYIFSWESSLSKYRLHRTEQAIDDLRIVRPFGRYAKVRVRLNPNDQRQRIYGFGAGITDAVGFVLNSLPIRLREHILLDYFSKTGIDYSMARVPMAGTDFSTRIYTYDDDHDDDFDLDYFSLQPEDTQLKIPIIKRAQELKRGPIRLIASAWSSPGWMKTNGKITGSGFLKGKPGGPYYKAWAKYYVKFLEAYGAHGINFWAITTHNEPTQAIVNEDFFYNSLGISSQNMRDWVKMDLGPVLRDAGYGTDKLHVLLVDDIREFLPNYTQVVLGDQWAAPFITGIAFHWYSGKDHKLHYENLNRAHKEFRNYFLISTEACEGYERFSTERAQLGNWTRAETYAMDIIQDLNRYTTGWLDWNFVLNTGGGPSWAENWTDSPILVDATKPAYYRNPMYYSMGHFSKFIPPGSIYIGYEIYGNSREIYCAAFIDPMDQMVMVILNANDYPVEVIIDRLTSISVPVLMDAHSMRTLVTPRNKKRRTNSKHKHSKFNQF